MEMSLINLKIDSIKIEEILDYKEFSHDMFLKFKKQIEKFGEIQPLTVYQLNSEYYLLDGFTRLKVYQKLRLEDCHCINLGEMTLAKAMIYRFSMSMSNDFDVLKLSKLLAKLKENKVTSKQLEKISNFTQKQIERLQTIFEWDWNIFNRSGVPHEVRSNTFVDLKTSKITSLF